MVLEVGACQCCGLGGQYRVGIRLVPVMLVPPLLLVMVMALVLVLVLLIGSLDGGCMVRQ